MIQLETIVILQQDLTAEQYRAIVDDYSEIIKEIFKPSKKIKIELLGKKKLSYEIKSNTNGWYVLFTYQLESQEFLVSKLHDLELKLRTDEQVLKFLSTKRTEGDFIDLDDIEEDYNWKSATPAKGESEQPDNKNIDAMDVLLGFAHYS